MVKYSKPVVTPILGLKEKDGPLDSERSALSSLLQTASPSSRLKESKLAFR